MTIKEVYEIYTPTIGIECHVQLKTKTKLFSGADNDARDTAPNTTISPICLGFPGVLPVLNDEAVTLAIRAGLALKADLPRISRFERKHYFYPDLPKGYQMTQLKEPVIVGGVVEAPQIDGVIIKVRIHHAHLEEDAGKLTHPPSGSYSLVDLNRAGTPLIEIVSEADMHSPAEAKAYAEELYRLMTFADVTNGDLYHGNMRFDVNISLAPKGETKLGTRAEIKNLNSFRSVEKAAEFECFRQFELLQKGDTITQETRGWNEAKQKTFPQRSKEDAHDYRYFPDADVPPVVVEANRVEAVKAAMPILPAVYREAWRRSGINESVISALLNQKPFAELVASVQSLKAQAASRVANWCASSVDGDGVVAVAAAATKFVTLADMVEAGELSSTNAKLIFNELLREDSDPRTVAETKGLIQSNDDSALQAIVDEVIADPSAEKAVADIQSGNDKAIGFLVGLAMKKSRGQGNPGTLQKLIRAKLDTL